MSVASCIAPTVFKLSSHVLLMFFYAAKVVKEFGPCKCSAVILLTFLLAKKIIKYLSELFAWYDYLW